MSGALILAAIVGVVATGFALFAFYAKFNHDRGNVQLAPTARREMERRRRLDELINTAERT